LAVLHKIYERKLSWNLGPAPKIKLSSASEKNLDYYLLDVTRLPLDKFCRKADKKKEKHIHKDLRLKNFIIGRVENADNYAASRNAA